MTVQKASPRLEMLAQDVLLQRKTLDEAMSEIPLLQEQKQLLGIINQRYHRYRGSALMGKMGKSYLSELLFDAISHNPRLLKAHPAKASGVVSKAKAEPVGTVKTWKDGKKYRKTSDGWKPMTATAEKKAAESKDGNFGKQSGIKQGKEMVERLSRRMKGEALEKRLNDMSEKASDRANDLEKKGDSHMASHFEAVSEHLAGHSLKLHKKRVSKGGSVKFSSFQEMGAFLQATMLSRADRIIAKSTTIEKAKYISKKKVKGKWVYKYAEDAKGRSKKKPDAEEMNKIAGSGPSEVATEHLTRKPSWEEAQRNSIDSKKVPKNLPVVDAANMFSTDDLAGPAANYGPVRASASDFSPEFVREMRLSPTKNSQFIMNVTAGPNKGKYVVSTEGYNYPRYMAMIKGRKGKEVVKGSKPPSGYRPMKHSKHGGYVSADGKKSWYPSKDHAKKDMKHHSDQMDDHQIASMSAHQDGSKSRTDLHARRAMHHDDMHDLAANFHDTSKKKLEQFETAAPSAADKRAVAEHQRRGSKGPSVHSDYEELKGMSLTALQGVFRREGLEGPKPTDAESAIDEIMADRHGEDWLAEVMAGPRDSKRALDPTDDPTHEEQAKYHDKEVQNIKRRLRSAEHSLGGGKIPKQYSGVGSEKSNALRRELESHRVARDAHLAGRDPTKEEIDQAHKDLLKGGLGKIAEAMAGPMAKSVFGKMGLMIQRRMIVKSMKDPSEYRPTKNSEHGGWVLKAGGEGSRGGVVIGHDSRGNPIYESSSKKTPKGKSSVGVGEDRKYHHPKWKEGGSGKSYYQMSRSDFQGEKYVGAGRGDWDVTFYHGGREHGHVGGFKDRAHAKAAIAHHIEQTKDKPSPKYQGRGKWDGDGHSLYDYKRKKD